MQKTVLIVIFLFLCLHAGSYQSALGSDDALAKKADTLLILDDLEKARILAFQKTDSAISKAIEHVNNAYDLSLDLDFVYGKVLANMIYAIIFYEKDDFFNAQLFLNKVNEEYTEKSNQMTSKYKSKAEHIVANAHNLSGIIFMEMNVFDKAIDSYQKAFEYFKKENDSIGLFNYYNNFGSIQLNHKDYDNAKKSFKNALEYADAHQKGLASTYNNLSLCYKHQKDTLTAITLIKKAIDERIKRKDYNELSDNYSNLGDIYFEKNNSSKALEYYLLALETAKTANNKYSISSSLLNLAAFYGKAGNYSNAIKYANDALITNPAYGYHADKILAYKILEEAYDSLGAFRDAYKYSKLVNRFTDTLNQRTAERKLKEIEFKQRFSAYENEAKLRELKLQLTNRNLLIAIAGLAILLLILYVYFRLRAKKNRIRFEQELLRLQMNPHFISNALTAVQSYIYTGNKTEAAKYLADFSEMMRLILLYSRQNHIELSKEVKLLTHYLELHKIHADKEFDYDIYIDEKIDLENTLIPPMLAQPFIENAIVHGISKLSGKGKILVSLIHEKGNIKYEITDNGVGFNNEDNNKSEKSMSISITKKRLRIINRFNKNKILLSIQDMKEVSPDETGTIVRFSIPLKHKK